MDKLNSLVKDTQYAEQDLQSIIKKSFLAGDSAIFNNAAQVFNHDFFWNSIKPNGGGEPKGKIAELINNKFGDLTAFKAAFKDAALTQFGSGWVWLTFDGTELSIVKTSNAETPLLSNDGLLLTCDVWEHAYYIDYRNRRADFVDIFLNNLVNWDFAQQNLDEELKKDEERKEKIKQIQSTKS